VFNDLNNSNNSRGAGSNMKSLVTNSIKAYK